MRILLSLEINPRSLESGSFFTIRVFSWTISLVDVGDVKPINRIAASIRKAILMMTSVRRPKLIFLNNQKCFMNNVTVSSSYPS